MFQNLQNYVNSTSRLVSSASSATSSSRSTDSGFVSNMQPEQVPASVQSTNLAREAAIMTYRHQGDSGASTNNSTGVIIPSRTSEYGEPLSLEKRQNIANWTRNAGNSSPSVPSSGASTTSSTSTVRPSRTSEYGERLSPARRQNIAEWTRNAGSYYPSEPNNSGASSYTIDSSASSSLPPAPYRSRPGPNRRPAPRAVHIPRSNPQSYDCRQLERLSQLSPDEAAEKLGRECFSDLIVTGGGESELYSKEERWEEIRLNVRMCHGIAGSGWGYTLFHAFAFNKRLDGAKRLLELGYDVDATDAHLWTGLHYAAFHGSVAANKTEMIRLLVEAGADVHKLHKRVEQTALHYVALTGDIASARFLVDQGADVNYNATRGGSPLLCAAHLGTAAMVSFLLDRGADINTKNCSRETALHYAAHYGRDDVIRVLLERGVDRQAVNYRGKTAADLAREWEYIQGGGKRIRNI